MKKLIEDYIKVLKEAKKNYLQQALDSKTAGLEDNYNYCRGKVDSVGMTINDLNALLEQVK